MTTTREQPPAVQLLSIASNGNLLDNRSPDLADADLGTDDRQFRLSASLHNRPAPRSYVVTYRATDLASNTTDASAQVVVRQR